MDKQTRINAGKNKFIVTEKLLKYGDLPLSYTLNIGGDYDSCVSVSYSFRNGLPISANLPYLRYEPECSIGSVFIITPLHI